MAVSQINQKIVERCLEQIKLALKEKGLKYTDVAAQFGIAEVTVKRMLNQSDIGLERLMALADIAALDVVELIQQAKQSPQQHYYFNAAQDHAFAKNNHLFHYFSELFYAKKTPEQIQAENNLTELSTYRYLRKLEDLELIELAPSNKVTFRVRAPLGFAANSRVLKQIISRHIQATCNAVMSEQQNDDFFMRVKPLRAPITFYLQLTTELKKVVDRYCEIAETAFSAESDLPTFQVTVVGHPFDLEEVELEPVKNIEQFD